MTCCKCVIHLYNPQCSLNVDSLGRLVILSFSDMNYGDMFKVLVGYGLLYWH